MHHQSTCIYSTTTVHQEVQLLKYSTVNPSDKQQYQVHQPVLNPVIAWCTRRAPSAPIASQTAPKVIYITKLVLLYNQVVLLLHIHVLLLSQNVVVKVIGIHDIHVVASGVGRDGCTKHAHCKQ